MVKNPPAKQKTQVLSLGQKDPLEKEMSTHSSILAWRTPWTEKPGRLQSTGHKGVGKNLAAKQQQHVTCGRHLLRPEGVTHNGIFCCGLKLQDS